MATADGYIRINTKVDSAGAKAGLGSLMGTLSKFAIAAGLAFGVKAIIDFGKECIKVASDLNEVQNVVDVTFGASASKINDFATTAATSFGLSQLAAKQYTGTMGAMFKSMGFGAGEAADMSIAMAGLAGDMASFYNLDTDEAFMKIRSGISGETEPLKQLGINLSEANLAAFALTQGVTGGYSALSEQNKALIRYNYLLSVSSDAQGDFVRTSDSWANQVRILGLQFDTLKATLGGAFIAVLSPVLKWVNMLLGSLNSVAVVFANFITALTGKQQTATTATAGTTSAMDDLTASTEKSGKAAAAAGKAAAKGAEGFDELNIMAADTGSGGSGGAGGAVGGAAGGATTAAAATPAIDTNAMLEGLKTFFAQYQDEIDRIKGSWDELTGTVSGLFSDLTAQVAGTDILGAGVEAALNWVYAMEEELNLLIGIVGKLFIAFNIPATIESALRFLSAAFKTFGDIIDALTPGILAFVDIALVPIAEWIGGKIRDALDFLGTQLTKIGDWFQANKGTLTEVFTNLGTAVNDVWNFISPILDAAWEVIKTVFDQIITGALDLLTYLMPLINKVSEFVTVFMTWLETTGIMDFIIAAVQLLGQIIGDVIDTIVGVIKGIIDVLTGVLDFLIGVFTGDWDKAWQGIQEIFSGVVDILTTVGQGLMNVLSDIWDSIEGTVTDVWNRIAAFFKGIWDGIVAVFEGIGAWFQEKFNTAWTNIQTAFAPFVAFFQVIWDSVAAIFSVVGTILGTAFTMAWELIKLAFAPFVAFFQAIWDGVKLVFSVVGSWLSEKFTTAWTNIKTAFAPMTAFFQTAWDNVKAAFSVVGTWFKGIFDGAWTNIKAAFNGVSLFFGGIWTTITTKFSTIGTSIGDAIGGAFKATVNSVLSTIEGVFNKGVGFINGVIGIYNAIPGVADVNKVATVSLPRLAQGAVIPPNRAFAAILGDQKHGTNIETPLDTMLQAFRTAFAEAGTGGTTQVQITFKGELGALAAILAPEVTIAQNQNNRRAGTTLQVV